MIGSTTQAAIPGLLGLLAQQSAGVKGQLDAALEQQSTGKVSDDYAGLGSGAGTSLDLSPEVAHVQTWQSNIDAAQTRLSVTQTALSQIAAIASQFHAAVATVNGAGGSSAGELAASAKQALGQVAQLLNTQSGGVYVFGGQSTDQAPVPDTDPATVGADLLASDVAAPPFSASIGTAVPQVEVGQGQFVAAGVLANANTLAVSGAPTTGSYMRDVMKGLAQLATLTDGGAADQATAAGAGQQLQSAISAMADETGALGQVQASLTSRQTSLATLGTALTKQVSNVQDVDMAATLTKVSDLQTQLQASYQAITGAKDLSLADYL